MLIKHDPISTTFFHEHEPKIIKTRSRSGPRRYKPRKAIYICKLCKPIRECVKVTLHRPKTCIFNAGSRHKWKRQQKPVRK